MDEAPAELEIDPEMFVTCRLCISAQGNFQITPKLQQKINYVYDIDVQLFDGYSQVLCEKCKTTVMELCEQKDRIHDLQRKMKNKTKKTSMVDTGNNECHELNNDPLPLQMYKKRKRIRITNSTSDEEEGVQSNSPTESKSSDKSIIIDIEDTPTITESIEAKQDKPDETETEKIELAKVSTLSENVSSNWRELYKHSYVCRYCNMKSSSKNSMTNHIFSHNRLVKKRRKLTRCHSTVALTKYDCQPNITGENCLVVINSTKFISGSESPDYYILYRKKETALSSYDTDNDDLIIKKRFMCEDIMSNDGGPKLRKRIRVQSYSSDETVDSLIELTPVTSNVNCNDKLILPKQTKTPDFKTFSKENRMIREYNIIKKTIADSIRNLRTKLDKTNKSNKENKVDGDADTHVQHQLLSCGRKINVKDRCVSMGLLKFLNHKNLKIKWKNTDSVAGTSVGLNSSNLRIHTCLADKDKHNLDGFIPCTDEEISNGQKETHAEALLQKKPSNNVNILTKEIDNSKLSKKSSNSDQVPKFGTPVSLTVGHTPPLLPVLPDSTTQVKASVLPWTTSSTPILENTEKTRNPLLQYLLNANPVPNPKKIVEKKNDSLSDITLSIPLNDPAIKNINKDKLNEGEVVCLDSDTEDRSMPYSTLDSPSNATTANMRKDTINGSEVAVCLNLDTEDGSLLDSPLPPIISNSAGSVPMQSINYSVPSINSSESKLNLMPSINSSESNINTVMPSINSPIATTENCMINKTSTESLVVNDSHAKESNVDTITSNISIPMIKCKPVSELMVARNDKSLGNINIVNKETGINVTSQSINGGHTVQPFDQGKFTKVLPPGYVVLSTVSLPNKMTNQPFAYFGTFLKMHGLELIKDSPDKRFINVVKFNLRVRQHNLSELLCLALEVDYRGVSFRIVVNKYNEEVDLSTLDALWQWEVLKAFCIARVIKKIQESAEQKPTVSVKNIGLFLSLLSSIQLISWSK